MKPREELINKLLEDYYTDDSVLGVIQVGSTAKGYHDESSDVDFEVIVTEEKYAQIEKSYKKFIHTDRYDLIFTTIGRLENLVNSEIDEDHWKYKNSIIRLDRTRRLKDILGEITRYDRDSRTARLKRYYLGYWNHTLSFFSCLKHKNNWGMRIYATLAVQDLIRLLFNLNYQWSPRLQWAFREFDLLEKKPADLDLQIRGVLENPDSDKLSGLWDDTAALLREEGFSWVDHPEEIM
jgi:predicted nucleotidyltransferase